MIKFFRRIRQQLLSENKFTKYLIYAAGEIVLVVIGILIALQINKNREAQLAREKEQVYLKEIHLDFLSNKEQLDSIRYINREARKAGERLVYHIDQIKQNYKPRNYSSYPFLDSMATYQGKLFANKSYNPKNGTVNALINSSSFDLIQNDSLRRMLVTWNDVLGDYLEEEYFQRKFLFDEYYPWIRSHYNYADEFSQENMAIWFGPQETNFRIDRIEDLKWLDRVVEQEQIVRTIDGIIRLTETEDND